MMESRPKAHELLAEIDKIIGENSRGYDVVVTTWARILRPAVPLLVSVLEASNERAVALETRLAALEKKLGSVERSLDKAVFPQWGMVVVTVLLVLATVALVVATYHLAKTGG